MTEIRLHGYFRSTASYRVRIALNLKGLTYRQTAHHLPRGEQRDKAYLALNPQGLVPTLEIDGLILTQSMAICEYLDERIPTPPLLPADPAERARVRAFAQIIGCDVHPVQNLKILKRLKALGHQQDEIDAWARTTIEEGLAACDSLIADQPGPFCFGGSPGLADILLVPQLVNARRFGVELGWPRLLAAEAACLAIPAFAAAAPAQQPDAE